MSSSEAEKYIKKDLENVYGLESVKAAMMPYRNITLRTGILGEIFEHIAAPDEYGFSKPVMMSDLISVHPDFKTSNGGNWCRSDSSVLGKKYIIDRRKSGNSISSVKLDGYNKEKPQLHRSIKKSIRDALKREPCRVLNVNTNIEIDHKNGKYDDTYMSDLDSQNVEDFQPLCKTVNDAKRSHCRKCKETGKRFDATVLGYSKPYILGHETTAVCNGCYWYDPELFNRTISKDFKKTDEE